MKRIIHAERDSVCIGDDVTAPNAKNFIFILKESADALMRALADYVPAMKNVVWEIVCSQRTIGYLFSDETGQYQYELAESVKRLSDLPSHTVYCKYYYAIWSDSEDCLPLSTPLLERVKSSKRMRQK